MPIVHGCSKNAVSNNIKAEMATGKSHQQAVAIALSIADKNANRCKKNKTH